MQERRSARLPKRLLALVLCVVLLAGVSIPASAAGNSERVPLHVEKVDDATISADRPALSGKDKPTGSRDETYGAKPDADDVVRVSIVLNKPSTIAAGYSTKNIADNSAAMSYRAGLQKDQASVQAAIESKVLNGAKLDVVWNLTLAANLISANVKYGQIEAIKAVPGVKSVYIERQYAPDDVTAGKVTTDPNMAVSGQMTGAAQLWDEGVYGEGSLIAIIDTGLDYDHQAFDSEAFLAAVNEDGVANLKLSKDDVAAIIAEGSLNYNIPSVDMVYYNEKIPYGLNCVDKNDNITHMYDSQGEHGSHVAGIAAANRLVDTDGDGEFEDARTAVGVVGNAPDAQLLIMKVFGENGGSYDSDCAAAIEDAIILGADAVNLSLGVALPGDSTPEAGSPYSELQATLAESETVVVFSAGNAGSWADYTVYGALYSDDVNFQMDGIPGSYSDYLTVASVDNDGMVLAGGSGLLVNGSGYVYTDNEGDVGYTIPPLSSLAGDELDFIILSYDDVDNEYAELQELGSVLSGKVIFFLASAEDTMKVINYAIDNGAAALVMACNPAVYHQFGPDTLVTFTGLRFDDIPFASVSYNTGAEIWDSCVANVKTTASGYSYAEGKLSLPTSPVVSYRDSDYYTMSSFSSWGTTGALTLKPEISAPGGMIYSVQGSTLDVPVENAYEYMSGTSMAAPQITGMSALVQQYLRDEGIESDLNSRALTQALLMSTAIPMKDEDGNYYSILQQGSGIANVHSAVTTPAYITVEGQDFGKVKAELGDDPERSGRYTVTFTIHNISGGDVSYELSADVFTQDVVDLDFDEFLDYVTVLLANAATTFEVGGKVLVPDDTENAAKYDYNGDGATDRKDAKILLDYVVSGDTSAFKANADNLDVDGDGDCTTHDVYMLLNSNYGVTVLVPAGESVEVTATIDVNGAIEQYDRDGAYVEAFIKASPEVEGELSPVLPELSFPVLAYYGSWTDASMFDHGTGEEWLYEEFDGHLPYAYGAMLDDLAKDPYNYTSAMNTLEVNGGDPALSGEAVSLDTMLDGFSYALIRNSSHGIVQITDSEGNLLWRSDDLGAEPGIAYYESLETWLRPDSEGRLYYSLFNLAPIGMTVGEVLEGAENADEINEITVTVIKLPEYYDKYEDASGELDWDELMDGDEANGEIADGSVLSTTVMIDKEAPVIDEENTYGEYVGDELHIFTTVSDDSSVIDVSLFSRDGSELYQDFNPLLFDYETEEPVFVRTEPGEERPVEFDGKHEYLGLYDKGKVADLEPDVYLIVVNDICGKESVYEVWPDGVEPTYTAEEIVISDEELVLTIGQEYELSATVLPSTLEDNGVSWTSDNECVSVTEDGVVTALAPGEAVVTATSNAAGETGEKLTATCSVTVLDLAFTLNGILWDENGDRYWTEFSTSDLPDYTKLSDPVEEYIQTAGIDTAYQILFTATYEDETTPSVLYGILDPDTFEMLELGEFLNPTDESPLNIAVTDMADTLGIPVSTQSLGADWVVAVSGTDFYLCNENYAYGLWKNKLGYDLVGVAYAGATAYNSDYADIYYLLDTEGNLFCIAAVVTSDGRIGTLSIQGADEYDRLTNIGMTTDVGYYNSLYYDMDGSIIWSRYCEAEDDVDIVVIDEETFEVTELGSFAKGVWPVGGLVNLTDAGRTATNTTANVEVAGFVDSGLEYVARESKVAAALAEKNSAFVTGGLDSIDAPADSVSTATSGSVVVDTDAKTVTVPVYASDFTNGLFTLEYDADVLTLHEVNGGKASLISYVDAAGVLKIGAADAKTVSGKLLEVVFTYESEDLDLTTEFVFSVYEDNRKFTDTPKGETVEAKGCPSDRYTDHEAIQREWYHDYVDYVTANGVFRGRDTGAFDPYANMTRAELWTTLYMIANDGVAAAPSGEFWFTPYQEWAVANDIDHDNGDRPFAPVTRQEAVYMIYMLNTLELRTGAAATADADELLAPFADADDVADWAAEAWAWAIENGIIVGDGSSLNPDGTALRSHIARILTAYLTLPTD